jgi:EAL domain-containing protein (putative c-di-GMP-specific phosphodiesterase class I)
MPQPKEKASVTRDAAAARITRKSGTRIRVAIQGEPLPAAAQASVGVGPTLRSPDAQGASLDQALDSMWMAYQPIVHAATGSLFGYEALLRSEEPTLPDPGALLDAAERLDRLHEVGRVVRERASRSMHSLPPPTLLFVNLHAADLKDETLFSPTAPLTAIAARVVLEITERASLDAIGDVPSRVARLREHGFRIAIDDLGAGYSGLTSFTRLAPDFVKLDMSLIRDIHKTPVKRKLVHFVTALCRDLGVTVVAEGIEVVEERDTILELGCDLLQGYLLGRPGRPFPEVCR